MPPRYAMPSSAPALWIYSLDPRRRLEPIKPTFARSPGILGRFSVLLRGAARKFDWWLTVLAAGPSQSWGSGGHRHWRVWVVGRQEFLPETGAERAVVEGAADLEQQVGPAPGP